MKIGRAALEVVLTTLGGLHKKHSSMLDLVTNSALADSGKPQNTTIELTAQRKFLKHR
jgi:hypothetical protein